MQVIKHMPLGRASLDPLDLLGGEGMLSTPVCGIELPVLSWWLDEPCIAIAQLDSLCTWTPKSWILGRRVAGYDSRVVYDLLQPEMFF